MYPVLEKNRPEPPKNANLGYCGGKPPSTIAPAPAHVWFIYQEGGNQPRVNRSKMLLRKKLEFLTKTIWSRPRNIVPLQSEIFPQNTKIVCIMTFGENTLKNLADKGIIVKWYVEDTFAEYYNKLYLQAYEDYFEYYRNAYNVFVSKENPQDVECARKSAQSSAKWKSRPYEHTKLYITYGEQGRTFTRTTGKSQLITEEQVEKWIASNNKAYDTIYGSFADNTQQLLRGSKIRHYGFIYPTTYGIGIWVFFNRDADKCKLWVENLLKSKNLDYYTEYSDARFVFRYKISKAKANIAKMNG